MRIRSTEKYHKFTEVLYASIPIYSLQGLTLDSDYHFTAGIEAAEFEAHEEMDAIQMFPPDEWVGKYRLCSQLGLPLYAIMHAVGTDHLSIWEITVGQNSEIQSHLHRELELGAFAVWWGKLKGTEQTKPLYEAATRLSLFDQLLEEKGLSWGGNVDGFILNDNMRVVAIIESRYTKKTPLEKYDPAIFYTPHFTRAGDYKTWKPVVLLASELEVPLYLLTFERKSEENRLGLSLIRSISKDEIKYQSSSPDQNIISGIENIRTAILENLSKEPPYES